MTQPPAPSYRRRPTALLLHAPESVAPGAPFTYSLSVENHSSHNLNGTQVVFQLPDGVTFVVSPDGGAVKVANSVVVTIGRLSAGGSADIHLDLAVAPDAGSRDVLAVKAIVRSSTALPVQTDGVSQDLDVLSRCFLQACVSRRHVQARGGANS